MDVEWDPRKAAENHANTASILLVLLSALEDENALTIEDKEHDEQRFKTLGMGSNLYVLYVIHTYKEDELIRIVSARKADRNETKQYYKGLNYE